MTYKLLTVDDSRTIRMIVKNAFKDYDCELFEAENGQDGLAVAAREKPDLIILDITMPVMTGIEMLRILISDDALKNIAVIMLTAESGRDHIMNIVKMGVKDYIVKPFKGEQLVERVKMHLNLTRRMDEQVIATQKDPKTASFRMENDMVVLRLPETIKHAAVADIESAVHNKISQMTAKSVRKFVLDISAVIKLNMTAIQLIISIINHGVKAGLALRLVGNQSQAQAMEGFAETSTVPTLGSISEAAASY